MGGHVLQRLDHEVQRLAAGQAVDAGLAEFLLFVAAHRRDEGLRQDAGVLDQVGDIEDQPAAPGLAVQYGKAVGNAQHPGGAGGQPVGQVVAVIEEAVAGSPPMPRLARVNSP